MPGSIVSGGEYRYKPEYRGDAHDGGRYEDGTASLNQFAFGPIPKSGGSKSHGKNSDEGSTQAVLGNHQNKYTR